MNLSTAAIALLAASPMLGSSPRVPAQDNSRFGHAVCAADVNGDGFDDVVVGEPLYDGTYSDEGRVFVYLGSASGAAQSPAWSQRGFQAGAHFGSCVANLGDVNGDGYADIAVGAPDYDGPRQRLTSGPGKAQSIDLTRDSGAVAVFLGSASGLGAPALFRTGVEPFEHFGISVAAAGDVNGDGFDDVLIGAAGTGANQGGAFLHTGSPAGPSAFPVWIVLGDAPATGFGTAVGGGGDLDGDGYDDVVVGAPDAGARGDGRAFVYRGSAAGLETVATWTREEPRTILDETQFGAAVTIVHDMNADGFDELCIGDPGWDVFTGHGGFVNAGSARIYRGSAAGPSSSADIVSTRLEQDSFWAGSLAAGDLDGDGLADLLLGGPGATDPAPRDNGGAILTARGTTGALQQDQPIFEHEDDADFGFAVAVGDVDGDGFDDAIVGEPLGGFADWGRVKVYRGSPSGLETTPARVLISP